MHAGIPPTIPTARPHASREGWLVASLGFLMLGILSVRGPTRKRQQSQRLAAAVFWEDSPPLQGLVRVVKRTESSMSRTPTVIQVEGLTRRFGKLTAVDHLSFKVYEGETLALWGTNGAGKTTVLRCLLGLLRFEGDATILGYSVKQQGRAVRQQIGYVPQQVHLHPDLTVEETAYFYAQLRGVALERADALLEEWGLQDHRSKPVQALSGGMKQKLALVVALLSDPPLLLLDEPTAHLDASARGEWTALLRRLKAQGKTLLFCTHQFNEIRALADRVIVLEQGRKMAELSGAEFVSRWQQQGSLHLSVPPDEEEHALRTLREAGYSVHTVDGNLVVSPIEAKQVEPLSLLLRAGVEVLDYEWRPPTVLPVWSLTDKSSPFQTSSEDLLHSDKGETFSSDGSRSRVPSAQPLPLWRTLWLLAGKEVRDARRNRWLVMLMGIFIGLALLLTLFGLAGAGQSGAVGFGRTFASLLNLSLLIVPLMGLLLGALSIAGERDQQTLNALLAQPLTPSVIVLGKFMGTTLILASAVLLGFGSSGVIIYAAGADILLIPFVGQLGLTLLLGWCCLAIGMVLSVLARRSATAVALALFIWLFLAFISDLGIIGTALALQLRASTLLWLTLLNPLQVFKIAVIQLMEGNLEVLGPAGLYARDALGNRLWLTLLGSLLLWLAVPFLTAFGWFTRKGAIE